MVEEIIKVHDIQDLLSGDELEIQPTEGEEWTIHNVYHEADATLKKVENGKEIEIDSDAGSGSWSGFFLHVTNDSYLVVEADEAGNFGYDGVKTREGS